MYRLFFSFYQNKTIGLHLPPPIIIPYYYITVVYSMNATQQKIAPGTQKSCIVTIRENNSIIVQYINIEVLHESFLSWCHKQCHNTFNKYKNRCDRTTKLLNIITKPYIHIHVQVIHACASTKNNIYSSDN